MAQIILFGGTFDPIHLGHLILARSAMEQCRADQVLMMPAHVSPHKTGRQITAAAHRLEMVSRAIGSDETFAVSAIEISRPPPSYTWDTLEYLEKTEPQNQFVLLLGWDQLPGLGSWYRAEELLARVRLAVMLRGHGPDATIEKPSELSAKTWSKVLGAIIPTPQIEISSTDIRNRVSQGLSIKYLVPAAVEHYIVRHSLYRG